MRSTNFGSFPVPWAVPPYLQKLALKNFGGVEVGGGGKTTVQDDVVWWGAMVFLRHFSASFTLKCASLCSSCVLLPNFFHCISPSHVPVNLGDSPTLSKIIKNAETEENEAEHSGNLHFAV